MTTLTQAEVNAIFDEHQAKFPQLTDQINELKSYYLQKLWHQMTGVLVSYVHDTSFDSQGNGNELIEFYNKLILKMNYKLDPLQYSIITIACSRQFESIEDSIKFLEEAKDRLRLKHDALKMLEIAQAEKKLALGKHHDCLEQLDQIKMLIEQSSDVDARVYAFMAQVYAQYFKRKDDHENYYKACL
jgi:hypothetical protein